MRWAEGSLDNEETRLVETSNFHYRQKHSKLLSFQVHKVGVVFSLLVGTQIKLPSQAAESRLKWGKYYFIWGAWLEAMTSDDRRGGYITWWREERGVGGTRLLRHRLIIVAGCCRATRGNHDAPSCYCWSFVSTVFPLSLCFLLCSATVTVWVHWYANSNANPNTTRLCGHTLFPHAGMPFMAIKQTQMTVYGIS